MWSVLSPSSWPEELPSLGFSMAPCVHRLASTSLNKMYGFHITSNRQQDSPAGLPLSLLFTRREMADS